MDQNNNVRFEEDELTQSSPSFEDKVPKMVKLVMKLSGGAVKEQRQAEYVLLGFTILTIIISFFLLFGFPGGGIDKISQDQMQQFMHPPLINN